MNNGSIAKRYSQALFDEASAQFIDQQVYEYFNVLYQNMKETSDMQRVLLSPRVPNEKKLEILITASGVNASLMTKEGKDPESESYEETLYTRFLEVVLEHGREESLRLMILIYRELYREAHGIMHVIFETAVETSDAVQQKVIAKVQKLSGCKDVELECHVRPELIGGFCVRIGDMRYDYSFKMRLENIRKQLWNR